LGDSWTWGDSLHGISLTSDRVDDPRRLTSIYGYHLKNLINDCDWINIAYPGTANGWIVGSASRFLNLASKLKYQKIIISVGLTDIGRDLTQKGFSKASPLSLHQTAVEYEKTYLESLAEFDLKSKFVLLIGRNFTSTFSENQKICKNHLPKRWIDISAENWPGGFSPPECSIFYPPEDISLSDKEWMLTNSLPNLEKIINFLDQCPLHYKKASKHPNEECHLLWAKYIFDYLQTNCLV
jgi:hypothetical protein